MHLFGHTVCKTFFQMASVTKRPDKVIGMHFFAPAHIMKLVENIYGKKTSAVTMATVMELSKKLRKVRGIFISIFAK